MTMWGYTISCVKPVGRFKNERCHMWSAHNWAQSNLSYRAWARFHRCTGPGQKSRGRLLLLWLSIVCWSHLVHRAPKALTLSIRQQRAVTTTISSSRFPALHPRQQQRLHPLHLPDHQCTFSCTIGLINFTVETWEVDQPWLRSAPTSWPISALISENQYARGGTFRPVI